MTRKLDDYLIEFPESNLIKFISKVDEDLGKALRDDFPLEQFIRQFWQDSSSTESIKFIIETAVRAMPGINLKNKIDKSRQFISHLILSLLGNSLKKTEFMRRNSKKLNSLRIQHRKEYIRNNRRRHV